MTMIRKIVRAQISALGDDEVEVVISTSALARDGHELVSAGCQLENYRSNPIVLWSHDPEMPVGNAEDIEIGADTIAARVRFAPLGISTKADEIRGLVKAGVIRTVSVGFDPLAGTPLDPAKPKGGQRFTSWELLEFSFVSVPVDTRAVVTARAHGDKDMATETDAQIGAPVQRQAVPSTRAIARTATLTFKRGLYDVVSLIYAFENLGWQVDQAKWEAAIEGDGSKVPAMLGGVLQDLGDVLLAMTAEELTEALAGRDLEPEECDDDILLVVDERAHIRAATSPAIRAFRRAFAQARLRGGKTLSAKTLTALREAKAQHDEGCAMIRSGLRKQKDGLAAIDDMIDGSGGDAAAEETTETGEGDGGQRAYTADFEKRQAELRALAPAA